MAESTENSASIASTSSSIISSANSASNNSDENKLRTRPEQADDKLDPEIVKLECPVCLQTCIHPARLPCGHVFCFLCVKGVAFKNRRCAMCRRDIPPSYLEHPQLVNGLKEVEKAAKAYDGADYQWYYEGRNGWWQYDERTSQELEESYQKKERFCKILVAGFLYIVDFEHKCQIRQNDPSRIRRVKRDLTTIPKKGVAGLRLETNDLTSGAAPSSNTDGSLSSVDLQAETNLLQMHRNIVVEESEDSVDSRINSGGESFDSDANNSVVHSFEEQPSASTATEQDRELELSHTINSLNSLTLDDDRLVVERRDERLTVRRRVVPDLFALSDSDDDNEDNLHVVLE
ncbi:E3 ubiquitin-protein ligase rnf146 [Toxorhynchites rutilus septentrionalis]|uniref:E3 ubiquitin-protein ligase rnf146 n=1 Tax=Toxorhynchites rutilus septentrionalis TaxID=329112 RepID=UPI002478FF45|nr:E3 ubiquitin-protein ligase rnf146 [Toxorhynchites rutilus septentrionalis]